MTTRERYFELCELAECPPDSPWIHYPGDGPRQVDWLWGRLADRGVVVERDEVAAAMDAFTRETP
ncbi:MAG: hypothetical protein ACREKH_15370 [Candidatus Rokuibacteriota bacterium]